MKNYLIFLLSLLFFFGCKKDDRADNIFFDDAVRQKYFYKKGSYWIYRDSISGRVDSFYVSDIYTHIPEPKATWYQDREEMVITITQKPSDTVINDKIEWDLAYEAKSFVRGSYKNVSDSNWIFIPTNNSQVLYNSQLDYQIPDFNVTFSNYFIGNFTIGSNDFQNVCEIHCNQINNNKNDCTYYFNDSVGYVKMRINFDNDTFKIKEVWELQRWKIVK